MNFNQNVQWFPGHMAKAKRLIKEKLRFVDLAIEIVDSRIPISSRNPEFDELFKIKPRVMFLNKCDLADEFSTKNWIKFLRSKNIPSIAIDCKFDKDISKISFLIKKIAKKDKIRCLVLGIPNVGKSSFINKMVLKKKTKVENRPATTKSLGWFKSKNGIEFLDTPGVLWPKFDDQKVGENLAILGSINNKILDNELLSIKLLEKLLMGYKNNLQKRFKIVLDNLSVLEVFKLIGIKRGMLISGGNLDTERTSNMILEEFRSGRFGKITLEKVEEFSI